MVYVLKASIEMPHTWNNASAARGAEVIWVLLPAPWSGSAY